MKTYRVPRGLLNLALFTLAFMTAIPLVTSPMFVRGILDPRAEGLRPGFQQYALGTIFVGYLLGMIVAWTHLLAGLVHTVKVHIDGTIEFRSFLRHSMLSPVDIESLELVSTEDGTTTHITHRKGRSSIPEQMGDLSELVSFLKSRNSRIEVIDARRASRP